MYKKIITIKYIVPLIVVGVPTNLRLKHGIILHCYACPRTRFFFYAKEVSVYSCGHEHPEIWILIGLMKMKDAVGWAKLTLDTVGVLTNKT